VESTDEPSIDLAGRWYSIAVNGSVDEALRCWAHTGLGYC
jgi:hypothetical protein